MTDYLKLYREIAENLYPGSLDQSGVSSEEIENAEARFGFTLPQVLSEFYQLVGNHRAINSSHNRLLSVEALEVEDKRLIFYEENQGVCYWGIALGDMAKDDPPVWVGQSIVGQDELDWHLAAESLSGFLVMMLCWQSVMGGLAFGSIAGDVGGAVVQKIKEVFSPVEVGVEYSGLRSYRGNGQIICLSGSDNKSSVYAGASDEEKFLEMENQLGVEWDYSTLTNNSFPKYQSLSTISH